MADGERPIIIKKKKIVVGGGHHGGAWKVAYADFVTAMMAFFLLMWLLNATSEDTRQGIADFFNPSIPVHRSSGGGDGPFAGSSITAETTLVQNGTGATRERPSSERQARGDTGTAENDAFEEAMTEVRAAINALGGESSVADSILKHIRTRVTDEGLVIELFDIEGSPLFEADSTQPTPLMMSILMMVGDITNLVSNKLAVDAHLVSEPIHGPEYGGWELSTGRALSARDVLGRVGVAQVRFSRITGEADRTPIHEDPFDIRNNRIELTLLRNVADSNN
ncbi:MAG: flagellar motor protein MotB [Pseudomonadota bacterium]